MSLCKAHFLGSARDLAEFHVFAEWSAVLPPGEVEMSLMLEPLGLGAAQEQEGEMVLPAPERVRQTSQIQICEVSLKAVCKLLSLKAKSVKP